jgi:hypothetical protein
MQPSLCSLHLDGIVSVMDPKLGRVLQPEYVQINFSFSTFGAGATFGVFGGSIDSIESHIIPLCI